MGFVGFLVSPFKFRDVLRTATLFWDAFALGRLTHWLCWRNGWKHSFGICSRTRTYVADVYSVLPMHCSRLQKGGTRTQDDCAGCFLPSLFLGLDDGHVPTCWRLLSTFEEPTMSSELPTKKKLRDVQWFNSAGIDFISSYELRPTLLVNPRDVDPVCVYIHM